MKIIFMFLSIMIVACQTNSHQNSAEGKMFVFETDTCNSPNSMELYEIDCLLIRFLKPKFISILDTPYIISREIAYLNRIVDTTRSNMVSVEFVKRNFYSPSVTYFLKSKMISATQMSATGNINLHLYDSFFVAKDLKLGLLVYDCLTDRNEKYYYGNFLFQRSDSILIDIEIALRDSSSMNTMDQVMCMLKSITFKDSTVLLPQKENDRFKNVKYFSDH